MQTKWDKAGGETGAVTADHRPPRPTDSGVIDSAALFRGSREITIHHEGALYRMKITRQGKLILNK